MYGYENDIDISVKSLKHYLDVLHYSNEHTLLQCVFSQYSKNLKI